MGWRWGPAEEGLVGRQVRWYRYPPHNSLRAMEGGRLSNATKIPKAVEGSYGNAGSSFLPTPLTAPAVASPWASGEDLGLQPHVLLQLASLPGRTRMPLRGSSLPPEVKGKTPWASEEVLHLARWRDLYHPDRRAETLLAASLLEGRRRAGGGRERCGRAGSAERPIPFFSSPPPPRPPNAFHQPRAAVGGARHGRRLGCDFFSPLFYPPFFFFFFRLSFFCE